MKRDYYDVLNLSKGAPDREIKAAYRKLAHEFHPDKNPGNQEAEEKFKEASEAYSVLSDAEKRARYDRFGHAGFSGHHQDDFSINLNDIFGDILGDLFGQGTGNRRSQVGQRGADLRYNLAIRFEEAAFGIEREITLKRLDACSSCQGSGAKAGSKPVPCRTCGGLGEVRISQGFFAVAQTCPHCQGLGQTIKHPCIDCRGSRLKQVEKTLKVKVPAGVDTGMKLKFSAEGDEGLQGGPRGDLYVVLSVQDHPIFRRDGHHVFIDLPISFAQAALGDQIEVPTLYGPSILSIPPGTQTGHVFKLTGKGFPTLKSSGNLRGDQLIQVTLTVPKKLNDAQKEALKQFAVLITDDSQMHEKSFFERVKDLL
ncbi:MAG: molecular chaperone DnaJ [Myxococcaceae bacterium]|nr:molecular chaperone DnaJ [Myxococcaceae bacterium]MBH2006304.1 molecular chaperone DnaJ [Myxococcaceae bacterium]